MSPPTATRELCVAIPVYNGGRTIRDTLLDVLKQTHGEFEIVVYDDGSKDNTPDIVTRIAQRESRVKLHRCEQNHGRGFARNALLGLTAGKLIAWQDADDEWAPTKLEEQMAVLTPLLDAGERAILLSTYVTNRLDDAGPPSIKTPPVDFNVDHIFSAAYSNYHFQLQAVLGPSDLFTAAGGFDDGMDWSEDLDVALKLLRSGARLVGHQAAQPLATYNHTLKRAKPRVAEDGQRAVRDRFREFAREQGYDIDKVLALRAVGYLGKMYLNRGNGQKAVELALRAMSYIDPLNADDAARVPAIAAVLSQAVRTIAVTAVANQAATPDEGGPGAASE